MKSTKASAGHRRPQGAGPHVGAAHKAHPFKETDITQGLERLKESNLNLQQMEKELLISGGYPADYLEVHPACPKCGDTGYVGNERCSCLNKLMRQINIEAINGVSALKLCDFSSFDRGTTAARQIRRLRWCPGRSCPISTLFAKNTPRILPHI